MRRSVMMAMVFLPSVILFFEVVFAAELIGEIPSGAQKPEQAAMLIGEVWHTAQWDENRFAANRFYEKKNRLDRQRTDSVFWSGETFVLRAAVTGKKQPDCVTVRIVGTGYETVLHRTGGEFEGALSDPSMMLRWGRSRPEQIVFVFEAEAGGKRLSDRKTVIIDDRDPYWLLHRKESKFWIEERELSA